jgi:hypothetical protein
MLTFTQVLDLLIMSTPNTSPVAHSPAPPPNTPEPTAQQDDASQNVNGNVEHVPSYGLTELGLRNSHTTQPDPTSNGTHTKNCA